MTLRVEEISRLKPKKSKEETCFKESRSSLFQDGSTTTLLDGTPSKMDANHPTPLASTQQQQQLQPDLYQWPVVLAMLPPLLAVYFGKQVDEWTDCLMLVTVALYLYGLVRVPWEMYMMTAQAARYQDYVNTLPPSDESNQPSPDSPLFVNSQPKVKPDPLLIEDLVAKERLYLLLVFACPAAGAFFLKTLKPYLPRLLDHFPLTLYLLTAYIRPLTHLSQTLLSQTTNHHQQLLLKHHQPTIQQQSQLAGDIQSLAAQLQQVQRQLGLQQQQQTVQLKQHVDDRIQQQLQSFCTDFKKRLYKRERAVVDDRFQSVQEKLHEHEVTLQSYRKTLVLMQQDQTKLSTMSVQRNRWFVLMPVYWMLDVLLFIVRWPSQWLPIPVRRLVLYPTTSLAQGHQYQQDLEDVGEDILNQSTTSKTAHLD